MRPKIAIVGGGLAGLSAAERLLDAGKYDVTVFEAKRHTGGRAGSFSTSQNNDVDYCQHVAMGCCAELLGLLRRTNLTPFWQRYESLVFAHPDFKPSVFRPRKWLPPPLHLLPTIASMRYFSIAEKYRLVRGLAALLRSSEASLVDRTAADWLVQNGQSERLIECFWEPILVSALGETVARVSMGPARKTIVDGFAATRDASDVWVPRLPLGEMFGNRLTTAIKERGAEVCTRESVRSIDGDGDGDQIWLSTIQRERVEFDAVIVAVAWYRIASLMGKGVAAAVDSLDQINDIAGSPITGIHLWFDRAVLRVPSVVMLGTTAQWLFASPIQDGDSNYVQVVISAAIETIDHNQTIDRDQLVAKVCDEIRALDTSLVATDVADAVLVESKVVTDPRSVFSVTPHTERIRPTSQTRHRSLFLAGDIVATGWPATMEGAVISGQMAAAAVQERFAIG